MSLLRLKTPMSPEMQRILVPSTLADLLPVVICLDNLSSLKYMDLEEFLTRSKRNEQQLPTSCW